MTTEQQVMDQAAIDYFDDLPPVEQEQATLEVLTRLAQESIELAAEISSDTVALAEKQERLNKLERVRIPEIMDTLGIAEFKLTDGSVVSVKSDIKAGITIANQPAAFKWLEDHHFDGIIKTNVGLAFGKGEMERAKSAVDELRKAGFDGASIDRSIHSATLKSFVKERLEDATTKAEDALPMEVFGVFEFKFAKIKLPKAKK
jgi:hypothetical protein